MEFLDSECVKCGTYRFYERENYIPFVRLAAIAQLGERQTEDLKVPGSIPGGGIVFFCFSLARRILKDNEKKHLQRDSNPQPPD